MNKNQSVNPPIPQLETVETNDSGTQSPSSPARRKFLSGAGKLAAAGVAAGAFGLPPLLGLDGSTAAAAELTPLTPAKRRATSFKIRRDAAHSYIDGPNPAHLCNNDETNLPSFIGNYSKGLLHNTLGEVNPTAYSAFLAAIKSGQNSQFDALVTNGHFGTPGQAERRRQVSPQAAYAFDLEGADSHATVVRPAPAFSSAEEAGEMAELYWMALLRDVPFRDYSSSQLAADAAADLSTLSDFRGPKVGGQVTPQTLFRDTYAGCTNGPYTSQFILKDAVFGAQRVDQRVATNVANVDFMTNFADWLDVQNGRNPSLSTIPAVGAPVFVFDGRALSHYVRIDALYQAYFVAALILLGNGIPFDAGNPYGQRPDGGAGRPLPIGTPGSISQTGFATFGPPHLLALLTEVSSRALKAVWYQKWLVHRRLRPETFGGRVEVLRQNPSIGYPIHGDLLNSPVLDRIMSKNGNYLLPIAFPEGSPMHPAYGSGHATVAGACVTVLKAWFDESAIVPNPVIPVAGGFSTEPYVGAPLTVGGELNKICSNVSQGRNIAGVHWRTDATEANKLGEDVAISILRDQRATYNESFAGFTLTKFDGTIITV